MKRPSLFISSGVTLVLLAASSLFLFQNCTQPTIPDDTSTASFADTLDFAYDLKMNEIGYMSCSTMSGQTYDTSAYFTLRMGGYDLSQLTAVGTFGNFNGGMRLTPAYLSAVSNRLTNDQWGVLSESKANTGTIPQMAIRHLGDLQNIQLNSTSSSSTGTSNSSYWNMFQELGTTGVSQALVDLPPNQRLMYLTDETVTGTRFEGSLYFLDSENLAASIRNNLNADSYALGITYTDLTSSGGTDYSARSPRTVWPDTAVANVSRDVYGRGYHLQFSKVAGSSTNYPVNLLYSVHEQDFHTSTDTSGNWTCLTPLRIIRPEDAGSQSCMMEPDPTPSSSPSVASDQLLIVRNILKYEDWWVDMTNHCIVPKKSGTGCYGTNAYVQYDTTRDCTANPATNNTALDSNMACMAYASICYRNN